jgi:O-antigen/teichoic acid export membrane protein
MQKHRSMKKNNYSFLLLAESVITIGYALILNVSLLYFLESTNYGLYAIGLTATAVAGLTAIGIQTLVPEYLAGSENIEDKIWQGIKLQGILVSIYSILIVLIPQSLINIVFNKIDVTKSLILFAGLYFYAQSIDDAIHVFLRTTSRARLSLILTGGSKLVILAVCIYFSIKLKDGSRLFEILAVVFFLATAIKIMFLIYPLRKKNSLMPTMTKDLISGYSSMWLGNVSNALFNGVMRLIIGESQGVRVIGMLAIASQIGSAFSSLTGALTLSRVMQGWKMSLTFFELNKNLRRMFILSTILAIICFVVTVAILRFYYLEGSEIINTRNSVSVVISISLAFSFSVLVLPFYQACQFYGKAKYIAQYNFILALLGSVALYILEYVITASSGALAIFTIVSLASAVLIIRTFMTIMPVQIRH